MNSKINAIWEIVISTIGFAMVLMAIGWALIKFFNISYQKKLDKIRRQAMSDHLHIKNRRMLLTPFTISYDEMEDEILDFNLKYKDQIDSETLTQFTGELYDTLQKRRKDIIRHKQLN